MPAIIELLRRRSPNAIVYALLGVVVAMVGIVRELRWRESYLEMRDEVARTSWKIERQRVSYLGLLSAGDSVPTINLIGAERAERSAKELGAHGYRRLVLWSDQCGTCARLDGILVDAASRQTRSHTAILVPRGTSDSALSRLSLLGAVYQMESSALIRRRLPLTPAVVEMTAGGTVSRVVHGHLFRVGQVLVDIGLARPAALESLHTSIGND